MYESFFNLKMKPFDLLPNPDFLFLSKSHKKAVTYLDYALRERAGFILLTGEVGSGKTTIIRDLIRKHQQSILLSKVFNTRVSSEQLIALINDDFGITGKSNDKSVLLQELNEFLIAQYGKRKKPVLIIDEAQNLSPETLEEVRMLSNLETDNAKLLQIILVGQPELQQTLALTELLQLRQRISFSCHLLPLTQEEVGQYILHRLEVAGNRDALVFSQESIGVIWRYSRGIPRLINIICDYLLLSAFSEGSRVINAETVKGIVVDLDFENQFWGESEQTGGNEEPALSGASSANQGEGSSGEEIKGLLTRIINRIEALEKSAATPDLKGLEEVLEEYGRTVSDYMKTTRQELDALRNDMQSMKSSIVIDPSPREGVDERKKGFLRNLFRAS